MKKHAILYRHSEESKQTRGHLFCFEGDKKLFECKTLELPWVRNKKNISCIHPGVYLVKQFQSESKGLVYLLMNVFDRTYIEIHAGNYHTDILGCILVGATFADINKDGLKDVTSSRQTLSSLLEKMGNEFKLTIK